MPVFQAKEFLKPIHTGIVCLFVWALEIPVMVLPYFQGVSSSPRGGVGTSLPGLTGGIPTRAWDRGGKQTFLTPRPVLS